MATQEQIDIIVKAITDQARKSLNDMNKSITTTTKNVKKSSSVAQQFKDDWLKVTAKVSAAWIVAKKVLTITEDAAKFVQSSNAMANQFGVNADKMIEKLSAVSGGTISNRDLVVSANRAMALNVSKDQNQIAKLLEFARLRARAMGTDTTDAFNDIVVGIGRGSPLILDNLGLITKGWKKEASAAGVAYDSQFILNKVLQQAGTELKKVGKLTETTAEKFQRARAQWENAKDTVGKVLIPVFVLLMEAIDRVVWVIKNIGTAWDWVVAKIKLALGKAVLFIMRHQEEVDRAYTDHLNNIIKKINKFVGSNIGLIKYAATEEIREQEKIVRVRSANLSKISKLMFKNNNDRLADIIVKLAKTNAAEKKASEKDIQTWQQVAQTRMSIMSTAMNQLSAISTQYFTNERMKIDKLRDHRLKIFDEQLENEKKIFEKAAEVSDKKFEETIEKEEILKQQLEELNNKFENVRLENTIDADKQIYDAKKIALKKQIFDANKLKELGDKQAAIKEKKLKTELTELNLEWEQRRVDHSIGADSQIYKNKKKRIEDELSDLNTQKVEIENSRKTLNDNLETFEKSHAENKARIEEEFAAKSRALARKQAKIQKATNIAQATMNTAQGITMALAQGGFAFGPAMATVIGALGAAQIALIAAQPLPAAQEGAMIRGSAQGTALIAGENNRTEAVIPLENPEAMEKLKGLGTTINISFNTETMIADEEFPRTIADKIDQALWELKREGQSRL